MDTIGENINAREMKAGEWYWVAKAVIQKYAPDIGCMAMAVYHLLASMADEHQRCFPSQKYIAEKLGFSRATVNRAIKTLAESKLIYIQRRQRYHHVYYLLNVGSFNRETQMSHRRNSDVKQGDTNKNYITRFNNDSIVDIKKMTKKDSFPTTRLELLAYDITKALNDPGNMALYLSYARKYPESYLRQILSEVKLTPAHKIKKSRSALFMYLVHLHAHKHP
jgi:DNA-binding transcriptional MocR family regulator